MLVEHQLQLRKLQEWTLHLRQRWRTLLSERRIAQRELLFQLRPRLHHLHAWLHEFGLRGLRKGRRSLLRRERVHGARHPVHVRQHLQRHRLRLQGVRGDRADLLFVAVVEHGVP